ncbi:unnamed protein product [Rotaria sordida]|uniref:SHSP domain-containing protein n=1 Tax=Rotaria sordida TaxID=392033 RepID=A0A815L942_9BILA|nr:unnamed protein product [Rotaria sordida]CAF4026103.1 unnamed protein product [Rotaria sordida]
MAAIPIILGGLAISGFGGGVIGWEVYRRNSKPTPYDVVIRINSLLALRTSGWEIILGETARNVQPINPTPENKRGVVIAVLGTYNRGKSFLLNELCNFKLPNGNFTSTEGISIAVPKKNGQGVIFIDTAGTDAAIPKGELDDKKATEGLLREIALHLCSYVIIVVNRLLYIDQIYIQRVVKYIQSSKDKKQIIIVHNLTDATTIEDVTKVIKDEVVGVFEAKPEEMDLRMNRQSIKISFYRSTHDNIHLRHFILAKNGSNAAKIWNTQSLNGMMNIFQIDTDNKRSLDVIPEMIDFVNTRISQLLIDNNQNNNGLQQPNQQRLQVDQHVKQPFIVLSDRKDLENLNADPHQLTISPRLTYDDAGYFIGIHSIDCGDWQPLCNVYETTEDIYINVELAGFLEKYKAVVTVDEKVIVLEGRRDNVRASLNDPIIRREDIPSGCFKLKIPLNDSIEPKETKVERVDGWYTITCPKKKNTAIRFE